MMANRLFVDTSGWASYLYAWDPFHAQSVQIYHEAFGKRTGIHTTDHVLGELVALLTSRH
jgi:predicted nucleic acid-binding protein